MNRFAVVGILAFLAASVALPTLAQTSPGVSPPRATMPPAPVAPSTPLRPLNPQRTTVARPARPIAAPHAQPMHAAATHASAAHLR